MHVAHETFKEPSGSQRIWRYMDLSKYLDLISRNRLFFSRVDKLDDVFEGSYSKPSYDWLMQSGQKYPFEQFRASTAVNCWHMNDVESAAMWKLYLKSNEGIAIQSTYQRLKDSLDAEGTIKNYIGIVDYIDFNTYYHDVSITFRPFLLKGLGFAHERELRVLIDAWGVDEIEMGDYGIYSAVDVATLVESVVLAPRTPSWIQNIVRTCSEKFGYNFQVMASSFDSIPLY